MRGTAGFRWLVLWVAVGMSPAPVSAETIEFVTYYPAPSATSENLHVKSLAVGDPPYDASVVPNNGVALISTELWLGTGFDQNNPPVGEILHVRGVDNAASNVVFMPGAGGTLNVGIGTAAPSQAALEIKGITNAAGNVAAAVSQSTNNAANAPSLVLRRFRGTDAAPAVIQNNDLLGTLQFEGYDGAQRRVGAQIGAEIDGVPGAGDLPTRLLFSTTADGAAAPAERMRITNAGNVGIGTAPQGPQGAAGISGKAGGDFTADRLLDIHLPGWAANDDVQVRIGDLVLNSRNNGGNSIEADNVRRANGNLVLGARNGIYFQTQHAPAASSHKMFIQNNGNVGIGTTAPSQRLDVSGTVRFGSTTAIGGRLYAGTPSNYGAGGYKTVLTVRDGGVSNQLGVSTNDEIWIGTRTNWDATHAGFEGYITLNAAHVMIRGTEINPPSDGRLKKEIAPIPNALDRISTLNGVNFHWKDDHEKGLKMGLVAQEVEPVFPELVSTDLGGIKSVNYPLLTAALVEAVKQLKAENEALRRRLEKLESTSSGR